MMTIHINSQMRDKSKHVDPLELMPHEDDIEVSFEEQLAEQS